MSNNVPKLRFKGFSGNWKCMEVGELCNISTGNKDTQDKTEKGIYPFFVRSQSIERINSYSYDGEAILTAGDGVGVGKVFHYVNCRFDYHQRVYKLSDFKGVNGRFLYEYFSNNFKREVAKYNAKTSVDSVRLEMITKMQIDIPSIEEQKKIASFLTKVDKIIEKQEEKISNFENYKKGIMQKIFSKEIRFKDEEGCDYPEWEEKKLREIASLVKDGTHGTHTDVDSGPYLLSAKNIKDGKIVITNDDRMISYEEYNVIYKNYSLKKDDILLSIVGTIGRTAIVKSEKDIVFQRSVAILRFDNHDANYIYQFMNTRKFQDSLVKNQVVSAQPGIYLNDLKRLNFNIPCLQEQTKIANLLSNIDLILEKEKEKLAELRLWKKGLLQQMFV